MHSDLYIAQHANLRPITEVAEQLGLGPDDIDIYGSPHIAKVRLDVSKSRCARRGVRPAN